MKLLSADPFWPIRDGLPASYPALEADTSCDVAVIGAGVSGALVAWQLANAGVETLVLDRAHVAHGSTAGSTSLLQYELDVPLHRLARQIGRERAEGCYRRCRDAIGEIARIVQALGAEEACGFSRRRSVYLASRPAHVGRLQREYDARRAAGFEVEWWARREVARESTLPHSAAIVSRDGAQIDAYRFTHALLADAVRRGARVFDRTAVTQAKFGGRQMELKTARGGRVRARSIAIATGYEAATYLKRNVTALHSTYALVSEPVASFEGWPAGGGLIWDTGDPYLYLRTTPDGRAMIGGYDEPFRDPVVRDRLLPAKTAALARRFRQLFPRIPFEVAGAWAGTFAKTPDGLPLIGRHPEWKRVWLALGYGGNGITFSVLAAETIRDGILGKRNADEALFGFGRMGRFRGRKV